MSIICKDENLSVSLPVLEEFLEILMKRVLLTSVKLRYISVTISYSNGRSFANERLMSTIKISQYNEYSLNHESIDDKENGLLDEQSRPLF